MPNNYIIVGDDEYVRMKAVRNIRREYGGTREGDLDVSTHGPGEIEAIMDSLGTRPFFSDKRLVIVRDADAFTEKDIQTVISYLQKPVETSVLVLLCASGYKKTKSYKELARTAKVMNADEPDKTSVIKWIRSFFKKEGIEISGEAVNLILELKGTDAAAIDAALEKLVCYSAGDRVDTVMVEDIVGRSITETVFKLVDAVNAGDAAWGYRILGDLYEQKKKPHEILGYLAWYVRTIQKLKLLSLSGLGVPEIAGEMKYSPGYVRRLMGQAKKYKARTIREWVAALISTDGDIKTGRREAALAMEMLIGRFIAAI